MVCFIHVLYSIPAIEWAPQIYDDGVLGLVRCLDGVSRNKQVCVPAVLKRLPLSGEFFALAGFVVQLVGQFVRCRLVVRLHPLCSKPSCIKALVLEKELMNIYVGNLSYRTTEDELRKIFEAFGAVSSASVINDRETGQSKGFGFVEMPSDSEAQAAINGLNDKEIGGRRLKVNQARPREEGGYRSGGGGGGRSQSRPRNDRDRDRDRNRW